MIKVSAAEKKEALSPLSQIWASATLLYNFGFVSLCTNLQEFSVTDHVCPQATFIFPIWNVSAAAANGPNQEVRGD